MVRITIKPIREYNRGSVTRIVLGCVAHHAEQVKERTAQTQTVINAFAPQNSEERNRVWKALKYLESQDHIAFTQRGGERVVVITPSGWRAVAVVQKNAHLEGITPRTPKTWDGLWRLVMFDIPLSHEHARLPLKQKLIDFGFETYQKSVFIHPYNHSREVAEVAECLGVSDFVRFVTARNVSNEDELKKIFDLM